LSEERYTDSQEYVELKLYLESMSHDDLVSFTLETITRERTEFLPTSKLLYDWLNKQSPLVYALVDSRLESDSLLSIAKELILLSKDYADLLNADDIVTKGLAKDDPGAYASLLLRRRHFKWFKKSQNHFTENKLSDFAQNPMSEHAKWLWFIERSCVGRPPSVPRISQEFDQIETQ